MSSNQIEEGTTAGILNKDEAFKILKENCKNFLKMSKEEKSEGLKINYLLNLINLSNNLNIDSNTFITTIFEEILFKDFNILKNRNILSNFISALESKKNPELFEKNFFALLNKFGSNYSDNSICFHQYLIDISLYYIFNSPFKCQEKSDYISLIIENDIKPFETQLLKNIINKNKKLIDENENKILVVKNLYIKFITMNKYKSCIIIFLKILENVNNNYKKIPKEIMFEIIKSTNNIGFNHVIKKTKEINDFLIFNCLLLDNLDEKLFVSEEELEMLDIYLVNILNLLSIKKDLNIDIFQKVYNYYNTQKYKNLNKIFPDVLYYLSTYSYFNTQYEFLFNCLNSTYVNPIYSKLITNHLLSLNKKPINYKESPMNKYKNIKFNIVDDLTNDILIDENLFLFENNLNNATFLYHINLYNYIINTSFSIVKTYGSRITINFYPKVLNRILILLSNLSLENSNKKYFEELLMLLLDIFTIIISFYLSINEFIFKDDYLFISFLKIIEKSSIDNKYLVVFPSFINIIKTTLLNSYENLSGKTNDNKLYNLFFDCLISNYSNISNNQNNPNNLNNITTNSQQLILIFKSLIILFSDNKCSNIKKDFFCLDKLNDLISKSNNDNVKLFESFYKLCLDLQKGLEKTHKHLGNYAINKYSKNINTYLNDNLYDNIVEKFNEIFIQKAPNKIPFDENTYYVINTISNIYTNEKIDNEAKMNDLHGLINDFCGSKLVIRVIDHLFISIEKNECDIINIINNDKDIYTNYNALNKALNNLDYYTYIYDNYFDNNIQKNSLCHYGILKSLAHLLSGYLSNCINSSLNQKEKENKSNEEDKIMYIFEYIKTKILLNKSLINTSYPIFFLSTLFKDKNNLHYFVVHYTNYLVNKIIKENIGDQSNYMQLVIGEMTEKNMAFIDYIKQNPYYILFMKDIIQSFIEFDSNMLNPNKNSLKKHSTKNKVGYKSENIVNKLIAKGDNNLSEYDEYQKIMFNSFFTKRLLDEIYEKNKAKFTYENNQVIFLFLLENSILDKFIDLFGYFVNIDYTLIQLYSFMRKRNITEELNEKYIHFINKYIEVDNFGNYIIRIMTNKKTFHNLFKCQNINNKYIIALYNIIENVMNNLSTNINESSDYSIQGGNIINIFNEIIEHINNYILNNFNFGSKELYLCGKIIKSVLKNLNKKVTFFQNNNNENANNTEENNNSNVINKINSIIEKIYSLVLPKYLKCFYNIIITIFDEKDKKLNIDYLLDDIFHSFYLIIDIMSDSKDNNNYYNILSDNIEPDIINFISNLLVFNKYKDYIININFYNIFKEKYSDVKNNLISKHFLEYLILFSLIKGKLDEKNLKSVIIKIFDEFKDNQVDEDFKKIEYLIFYFLSSIKKDNVNVNKSNNNTSMNYGDFSILTSIGERFKEDEKSLQKKNPAQQVK